MASAMLCQMERHTRFEKTYCNILGKIITKQRVIDHSLISLLGNDDYTILMNRAHWIIAS